MLGFFYEPSLILFVFLQDLLLHLKFTDPLGHYLCMTIGIIWSLAAKGRLILKKYMYFGKTQNKEVNHWVLQPDPPPPK